MNVVKLLSRAKKAIADYLKTWIYDPNEPLFVSKKRNNGRLPLQRDQAYKIINKAAREITKDDLDGVYLNLNL